MLSYLLGYQEYRTDLLSATDAMLTKKTAPKDALDTLQKQTQKIVKESK